MSDRNNSQGQTQGNVFQSKPALYDRLQNTLTGKLQNTSIISPQNVQVTMDEVQTDDKKKNKRNLKVTIPNSNDYEPHAENVESKAQKHEAVIPLRYEMRKLNSRGEPRKRAGVLDTKDASLDQPTSTPEIQVNSKKMNNITKVQDKPSPLPPSTITPEIKVESKKANDIVQDKPTQTSFTDKVTNSISKAMSGQRTIKEQSEKIKELEDEIQTLYTKLQESQTKLVNMPKHIDNTVAEMKLKEQEKKYEELQEKLRRLQADAKSEDKIEKVNVNNVASSAIDANGLGFLKAKKVERDQEKIEECYKQFARFSTTLKELAPTFIESFNKQISAQKITLLKGTTPTQQRSVYMAMLQSCERMMAMYMKKNIQFLVDKGFRKNIDYMLLVDAQNYRDMLDKFMREINAPFFKALKKYLNNNFVIDATVEDKDELEAAYDKLLEKIDMNEQKIYDIYNNNLSLMDTFNQTFFVVYALKALRIVFIWFSLYLASKILQDQYVSKVFANNEDPPSLTKFVMIFLGLETIFMVCLFVFLLLLKYLFDRSGDFIINGDVLKKFFIDYALTTVFVLILGMILASLFMQKKYFRYKTDGLRAIRGLQQVMLNIACVISFIPFFMLS